MGYDFVSLGLLDVIEAERENNRRMQDEHMSSVVITGLPADIPDENLESAVKDLIREICDKVNGIESIIHHKDRRKILCKFLKKEYAYYVLNCARNLMDVRPEVIMDLSLCDAYLEIRDFALKLKYEGKIADCWVFDSSVYVKLYGAME